MKCEYKVSDLRYWDMRHEFVHATTRPCLFNAKYAITLSKKDKNYTIHVCGIHKNSLIRHGTDVGYEIEQKVLNGQN